jgi:hypothetical protein
LCILFPALVPESLKDPRMDFILTSAWNLHRLEPAMQIPMREWSTTADKKREFNYGTHLYIARKFRDNGTLLAYSDEVSEAICVLSDFSKVSRQMQRRMVDPEGVNIGLLTMWILQCEKLHPITCKLEWLPELTYIRLIEVQSRQIIEYPRHN